MKENPVGSPFHGAYPCDSIRKATKDVSVHSSKLYQRTTENFEATTYITRPR